MLFRSHFPLPFVLWCTLCLGSSKAEISSFHGVGRHPFVTKYTIRHLSLSLRTLKPLHTFPLFCTFAHLFFYCVRIWPFFVRSWSLFRLLHPTTPVSLLGLGKPLAIRIRTPSVMCTPLDKRINVYWQKLTHWK